MSVLVDVVGLSVVYPRRRREPVVAVDDVTFAIDRGRTLGLVGESGSGKSSIGSVLLGLQPAAAGTVRFDGAPLERPNREARAQAARRIQAVFQNPFGSMNPTRTVGETLSETLRFTLGLAKADIDQRLEKVLHEVSMPMDVLKRYPGQFSGGQLQRLAIARALVVDPEFVVCDEAVSALDLSVQAQVVNLLRRLGQDRGLSYLFISHDLSVVRHVSDDIAVLYAGRIVELGPAVTVADWPAHPYTRALALAAPVPEPARQRERRALRLATVGQASAGTSGVAVGCAFAARCLYAVQLCRETRPDLVVRESGAAVACHRYDEIVTDRASARGEA